MKTLLNFLIQHFLFAGTMFFAAGAPGIVGGDGGASGQDAGIPNVGGDSGGDSSADSSESASQQSTADDQGASTQGDETSDAVSTGVQDSGAKWKTVFDAAKTAGIEKEVRALFFGSQKLKQAFPGGVNEAVALKAALEQHGGVEAIESMKGDLENYQANDQLRDTAPDKWVAEGFEAFPEVAFKAFAHSLDIVAAKMPEQYDHLMSRVMLDTMNQGPIGEIWQILSTSTDPNAKAAADKLASFYHGIKNTASKVPEKKIDAQQAKLDARDKDLNTKEETLRNHTVNSSTIPRLGQQMTSAIEKEAKLIGFDLKKFHSDQPGAARSMRTEILNKVMQKAASDATFVKQYKSIMKTGDTQRAIAMMNKKHDAILPEIVRSVAAEWGIKKNGANKVAPTARTTRSAPSAGSGVVERVSAKPHGSEIDWSKTGNRIYDSEAVLKTGKVVKWA